MGVDETRFRAAESRSWESVGVAPTEQWLTLPSIGTRARVQCVGDGPPVLFVHGGSVNGTCFAPLVARLVGFRCLVLDRPGCGLSEPAPPPSDVLAFQSFADALVADVLDGLDLPRAHVVATSFGGYFALRGAAAHPDRIDRMVELGFPIGAPSSAMPLMMRVAGIRSVGKVMTRLPVSAAVARSMLRRLGVRDTSDEAGVEWFRAVMNHTRTMRNEMDAPVLEGMRGVNPAIVLGDELLARIRCPVHFIWGTDDPIGGSAVAEAFVPRIPGATLELVPHSGHVPWLDEPDGVATSTATFLRGDSELS